MSPIIRAGATLQKRRKELSKRKNFLPTLFLDLCLWIVLALFVLSTDPAQTGAQLIFFILFTIALFLLISMILAHTRRGLLVSLAITIFLILRSWGVGNVINALLLIGVVITFEIYFSRQS